MLYRLARLMLIALLLVTDVTAQNSNVSSQAHQKRHATNPSVSAHWYIFTGPDRDFIVNFPFEPQQGTEVDRQNGTMRRYSSTKGSLLFQLIFWETGFASTSRKGNQFSPEFQREMLDQAKQEGWTVIRSQLLNNKIYEQERWTPMDSNPNHKLHLIVRHIRRYGREYILSCSSLIPAKVVDAKMCRQFFTSFRVTSEPHPQ